MTCRTTQFTPRITWIKSRAYEIPSYRIGNLRVIPGHVKYSPDNLVQEGTTLFYLYCLVLLLFRRVYSGWVICLFPLLDCYNSYFFISDHQIRRAQQKIKENPFKSFLKLDWGHLLRKKGGFSMLALTNIILCGYLSKLALSNLHWR